MPNFRPGYLEQGGPLGAADKLLTLTADNTIIQVEGVSLLRLSSTGTTSTTRTFTLGVGERMGHVLNIVFESPVPMACELLSSGNAKLSDGNVWTADAQYDSIQLQWNGEYWVEATRNTLGPGVLTSVMGSTTDSFVRLYRATITAADFVAAGTTVPVLAGPVLPVNMIVLHSFYDVTTTFAGDGDDSSTISMGIEDQDDDMLAAIAISDGTTPFDEGQRATIQVGAASLAIKLTEPRQVTATWTAVATDTTLSAGSMNIIMMCMPST